jgi:hypothetical protein
MGEQKGFIEVLTSSIWRKLPLTAMVVAVSPSSKETTVRRIRSSEHPSRVLIPLGNFTRREGGEKGKGTGPPTFVAS